MAMVIVSEVLSINAQYIILNKMELRRVCPIHKNCRF